MTGGSASTFPATRLVPPSRQLIPARRGAVTKRLLQQRGIRTVLQLRDVDTRWARQAMTVVGARTVMELRGVSCLPRVCSG
jgi:hypothetical protein